MEATVNALTEAYTAKKISEATHTNARKWLTSPDYADYQADIARLIEEQNFTELENSFHTIIPFGTGGRRGTCGIGPNRINTRTIGESAQGLAAYIGRFGDAAKQCGVVIACDTRNTSDEFAKFTAKVLCGNGIKTYLFREFRATPELSFAVRQLGTIAGVVISASHNPPSDNGFKAYWEDGGQVVPPHDKAIIEEVNKVTALNVMDLQEAEQQGLFQYVGPEMDQRYVQAVAGLSLTGNRDVRIVYSPLHGTGQKSVLPVLREAGFTDLHLVEEQMVADGNFPAVKDNFPNPELPAASGMAMALAKKVGADIGLTSDPDADRLGVFCKHTGARGNTDYVLLSGNQVGVLLVDFLLNTLKSQGKLPEKGLVVKTLVTTDLASVISRAFGVRTIDDLLVGFKYIGEVILHLPEDEEFLFGVEESLGYLRGTFVRDKDASTAAISMAELMADLKAQGKSPVDRLDEIFRQYGYFHEDLTNAYVSGAEGVARVVRMMEGLRERLPTELGGTPVVEVIDRKTGTAIDPKSGSVIRNVEGAKGDVLVFVLSEDAHTRVTIRPSGTEPKIKYYGAIHRAVPAGMSDADLAGLKSDAQALLDTYAKSLIAEAEKRS